MDNFTEEDIRDELGNPSDEIISNTTIQSVKEREESYFATAAGCAEIIARHFSLKADKSLGTNISVDYQERAQTWRELAQELRSKATGLTGEPIVGGISKTDKEAQESDNDRVEPYFKRGQFEIDKGDSYGL